jgi:4-hydroxy-4-methyl-2-oxoglutarate aldolase
VIIADDDGVLCVPRRQVQAALEAADTRVRKEEESRAAYLAGALSLDRNNLRGVLAELGVRYVSAAEYETDNGSR